MIQNLTVIGNGVLYYFGTPPLFGSQEVVGQAVRVDISMFNTAKVLVEVLADQVPQCKTVLRMLHEATGATQAEADAAIEMVLAILRNRSAIDRPTIRK